jgi:NADPH-dependent 2,4-dienoyl-CoA reductase/sulfur reductase-like enzyme
MFTGDGGCSKVPPGIMTPMRLLIVGAVAGGASAAARARRLSEAAEIIVFERGPQVSFANCGLPYFVGGEIARPEQLLLQTPARLKAWFNLDVRVQTEVIAIDRLNRRVKARDLVSGREYEERYDALILSPGAAPFQPPIPGLDRPGHFTVRNIPDVERIMAWLKPGAAERAVVVGGGYIGLEMAEQLQRRGLKVSLVEALPQVMAPLDPEMAAWLHLELKANGVGLFLSDPVVAFEAASAKEPARASVVALKNGTRLPADVVILGLGVKPESGLAKAAGLELGHLGGIRVNEHLQTSDPEIYAVGDAIEVRETVSGVTGIVPLAGPANRQGRLAADHIFGRKVRYKGTQGTAILRLFNLTAACTGANEKTLLRVGIPYEVVHLHPGSHAGYYPGAQPIALKLIFEPTTGKLQGAQAIGREGVDKRIDGAYGGNDRGRSGRTRTGIRPALWLRQRPGEPRGHGRPKRDPRRREPGPMAGDRRARPGHHRAVGCPRARRMCARRHSWVAEDSVGPIAGAPGRVAQRQGDHCPLPERPAFLFRLPPAGAEWLQRAESYRLVPHVENGAEFGWLNFRARCLRNQISRLVPLDRPIQRLVVRALACGRASQLFQTSRCSHLAQD